MIVQYNQLDHTNNHYMMLFKKFLFVIIIQSLTLRERGVGPSLESHMTNEGFNNQIGIDLKTVRSNFVIAAVVAPDMFDKNHIWLALILLGKYGIKTLDPK